MMRQERVLATKLMTCCSSVDITGGFATFPGKAAAADSFLIKQITVLDLYLNKAISESVDHLLISILHSTAISNK